MLAGHDFLVPQTFPNSVFITWMSKRLRLTLAQADSVETQRNPDSQEDLDLPFRRAPIITEGRNTSTSKFVMQGRTCCIEI